MRMRAGCGDGAAAGGVSLVDWGADVELSGVEAAGEVDWGEVGSSLATENSQLLYQVRSKRDFAKQFLQSRIKSV